MNVAAKQLVGRVLRQSSLGQRVMHCLRLREYLDQCGWFRSVDEQAPVDQQGGYLPWYTYPAIAFLQERVHENLTVFEYGSGNSTLWWSARTARVVSCEHHPEWYTKLKPKLPSNVEYLKKDLETGEYRDEILAYRDAFEIIIIDGRDRVECAKNCLNALKEDGIVLWDNSDREQYTPGFSHLLDSGFRRLDFWGLGPVNRYPWCTSIFYRDRNCLGI